MAGHAGRQAAALFHASRWPSDLIRGSVGRMERPHERRDSEVLHDDHHRTEPMVAEVYDRGGRLKSANNRHRPPANSFDHLVGENVELRDREPECVGGLLASLRRLTVGTAAVKLDSLKL